MFIELNHTIVPAHDKVDSASFYAEIFGVEYTGKFAHFAALKISDSLTFYFAESEQFESHHYAFKVDKQKFDEIFQRIKDKEIVFGSGPNDLDDMRLYEYKGERGFYFCDSNGHVLELLTAS